MKWNPKTIILNSVFVLVCAAVLLILINAPEESTSRLPVDETHKPFQSGMSKKEAEKNCVQCHTPQGQSPLPDGHPPPYRCLFCHKRQS